MRRVGCWACLIWLAACSADPAGGRGPAGGEAGVAANPAGSAGAAGAGTGGMGGTGGFGNPEPSAGLGGFGGTGGTIGSHVGDETECNGVDDDDDGVVDDVDLEMDGVCDCLSVATIGSAGLAGQGNVFSAWLDARSNNGAVDLSAMTLSAAVLEPFQVLVAQNVELRAFNAGEIDAVEAWVRAGGGLMTLIGYSGPTEANTINMLLSRFDVSYGTTDVMMGGCPPGGIPLFCPRESKPVTEWSTHPIAFDVTQVGMDNGKPVMGSGAVIATGEGHDLAMAIEADEGKVFVWGDEWITFDSEWSGRPEFQVERFWTNALKWLTPTTRCQVPPPPPPQ